MKRKYVIGLGLLTILVVGATFAFTLPKEPKDFEKAKEHLIIRNIGHELLLHAGDSLSRVLPVNYLRDNGYQVQFESSLSIQPDTLISIVHKIADTYKLPDAYIVNVLTCANRDIVYGYARLGTTQQDLVPCQGRSLPKNCYILHLQFPERKQVGHIPAMALPLMGLIALIGFIALVRRKPLLDSQLTPSLENPSIQLGDCQFFPKQQYLAIGKQHIELTQKETQLLSIFAQSPNHVLERDFLQDEVWGKEGVIVGRSLDVFVSKLRKKLAIAPSVKLVNVHGTGYKLQVEKKPLS